MNTEHQHPKNKGRPISLNSYETVRLEKPQPGENIEITVKCGVIRISGNQSNNACGRIVTVLWSFDKQTPSSFDHNVIISSIYISSLFILKFVSRRWLIFPHKCSIVSAKMFNFRVRNGNGLFHNAWTTVRIIYFLVAGDGLEPSTFGLWAQRAAAAPPRN